MIVISAKNLTKEFDGTNTVLEGVSFHINKGDRVGVIGINGAGKTTLLKVLAGQLQPEEGDYFISDDLVLDTEFSLDWMNRIPAAGRRLRFRKYGYRRSGQSLRTLPGNGKRDGPAFAKNR